MTDDLSPLHIPPRAPESVDTAKPAASPHPKTEVDQPTFQETLKQTLGSLSREADQIANGPTPSFEDVPQAMEAAKNAFQDTMQAHQMMQQLVSNMGEPDKGKNEDTL